MSNEVSKSEKENTGEDDTDCWCNQYDLESAAAMDACFTAFDKNGDGYLDEAEFKCVCRALFRNDRGKIYNLEPKQLHEMFSVFDANKDGYIDRQEFVFCWNQWIKKIVRPVSVFLVVDVQNDFITGALNISNCSAKQNGAEGLFFNNFTAAMAPWRKNIEEVGSKKKGMITVRDITQNVHQNLQALDAAKGIIRVPRQRPCVLEEVGTLLLVGII